MVTKQIVTTKQRRRFEEKYAVDFKTDCWLWTASTVTGGYGRFRYLGKLMLAHRAAYEMLIGPIPAGLVIDHLCRTRRCVNPSHMEPVTQAVNISRGNTGKHLRKVA